MKTIIKIILVQFILDILVSCSGREEEHVVILGTTDLHGIILPYDFIEKESLNVSMAGIADYVRKTREEVGTVLLLDGGDNLQGQPAVYYYNFIDTAAVHINSKAMNLLQYDAATVGNHDIEAGHKVYDRLAGEYQFPLLAANAVKIESGRPYFTPFIMIERNGIRIAVLGLVTPSIPDWLPPELYSGIEFRDMVETAKAWMPEILAANPDIVVGVFHSGWSDDEAAYGSDGTYPEKGSASVAREVPGFDVIFNGHDHNVVNRKIVNKNGDTILILDGGSRAEIIMRADIRFSDKRKGGKQQKSIKGEIIKVENYKPDPDFTEKFEDEEEKINTYVNKVIATAEMEISSRDAYFGPSAFVDMIHEIQLKITEADISFAAPLSFDVKISPGPVTVGDMFKLYRFENMLYTMSMTGKEIKKYLEFSYSGWLNKMKNPGDMLLRFRLNPSGKPTLINGRAWLENQPYNFDSAAGIDYEVDVRKDDGARIFIKRFSDGREFDLNKTYNVAVNSYRANGGGGHLTEGAGIEKSEMAKRLISSTQRDLRYFILKSIESEGVINPRPLNNWKIVPEEWLKNAKPRDFKLLFGN